MSGTALEKKELCEDPVELMRIYKQTGDLEVRNQLVVHYMDSVKKTVMSMRSILPGNMQYDDFVNQGVLALIDCIEKYQFDRGASFDTYIYKRLRGSVLSYMRKQSWLPYRVRAAKRNIQQEQERMIAELGREPTNAELAERLQMSQKELDKIWWKFPMGRCTPLRNSWKTLPMWWSDWLKNTMEPIRWSRKESY